MVFQTDLRPAFVEPIPASRVQIRRMMLAAAWLVDGIVDTDPGRFQRYLAHCFLMPHARLVIGGSLCRRPLVLNEFALVCSASDLDGILVRLHDEISSTATFDIKQAGVTEMLCAYRLWMPQPSGPAWLIPTAGKGPFVRLDPHGLDFSERPPFDCDIERCRGCEHGTDFLSVAGQGWF